MLFKLTSEDPPKHRYTRSVQTSDCCCSGSKMTKKSWRLLRTPHNLSALKIQRARLPMEGERFPKIMEVFRRSDQTFSWWILNWAGRWLEEVASNPTFVILPVWFQRGCFCICCFFCFPRPFTLFLYCIEGMWMGRYMQSWYSTYFFLADQM